MAPPRPPPKSTAAGAGNRSAPPRPSPPLSSANRSALPRSSPPPPSSGSAQSRPMGKIVRLTSSNPTNTGGNIRPPPPPIRSLNRKRDHDFSEFAATSRSFVRSRENPTAAAPIDRSRAWKRRIVHPPSKPADPDPPAKDPNPNPKPAEPAPVPIPTPPPPVETKKPDPDPDPKPAEPKRGEDLSTAEEGEIGGESEPLPPFEKAMMEFDELMTQSTAWIGGALRSVVGDLEKLAARRDGKEKLVGLVNTSVSDLLQPAMKHFEVIGEIEKSLERSLLPDPSSSSSV